MNKVNNNLDKQKVSESHLEENKNQKAKNNSSSVNSCENINKEKESSTLKNCNIPRAEDIVKKDKFQKPFDADNQASIKSTSDSQKAKETKKNVIEIEKNKNPFFSNESNKNTNSSIVNPFLNYANKNSTEASCKNPFSFISSPSQYSMNKSNINATSLKQADTLRSQNPFSNTSCQLINSNSNKVPISSNEQSHINNTQNKNNMYMNPFASESNKYISKISSEEESKRKEKMQQLFSGPHISEISKEQSDNDENGDDGYDPEAEEEMIPETSTLNKPKAETKEVPKLLELELAALAVADQWKGEGIISISKTSISDAFSIVFRNKMKNILFDGLLTKKQSKNVTIIEQKGSLIAKVISLYQNRETNSQQIRVLFCKFRNKVECDKFVSQINQILK